MAVRQKKRKLFVVLKYYIIYRWRVSANVMNLCVLVGETESLFIGQIGIL